MTIDHPSNNRYIRQERYAPIGGEGQALISQSHIAIVGLGALGCVVANHLARAGAGRLTLIDRDIVETTNLQRQLLYDEQDAAEGTSKAVAAARRLGSINSQIQLKGYAADLTSANIDLLLNSADVVVDATDNFGTRQLINEWCVKTSTPWVYGAAVGASGATMTIIPGRTPCLACLFPQTPPGGALDTCETAGVLAPIIDTIASIQVMETLKLITGNEDKLHGNLLQVDLWRMDWLPIGISDARLAACPVCVGLEFKRLQADSDGLLTVALCGRNTVQVAPAQEEELDLPLLAKRWQPLGVVDVNAYLLRLEHRDGLTVSLFPDGRALVSGTDNPDQARRLYRDLLGE